MGERERHRAQGRENKGAKEKGESTYQFGVDFGVQSSVADKVDDPSLGLLGGHVQLVCQHTERHTQTHTHKEPAPLIAPVLQECPLNRPSPAVSTLVQELRTYK